MRIKGRLEQLEKLLIGDDLRVIIVDAFDNGLGGEITGLHPYERQYEDETKVHFYLRVVVPHEISSELETCRNLAELRKIADKHNCTLSVFTFREDPKKDLWV